MEQWELIFINDMKDLAASSEVFARIVAHEWDGTMTSVNSARSLVRNAMITRWSVYEQCFKDDSTKAQKEWEKDLLTSDFYSAALQ